MKVYTKTGDAGDTGLVGGARVPKTDLRIEAIGAIDELNAAIGACRLHATGSTTSEILGLLQHWLFDIGAELAGPGREGPSVDEKQIAALEKSMDDQTERLEPLRHFVLPGGSVLAATLHQARTVCRRAERDLLRLHQENDVGQGVRTFINRLSDWLFVSARTANHEAGVADVKWKRG